MAYTYSWSEGREPEVPVIPGARLMMSQLRAMEMVAEAHRRELGDVAAGRSALRERAARQRQEAHRHAAQALEASGSAPVRAGEVRRAAMQRSTTGLPVSGGRAVWRPARRHVGALLIRAGVRLGGTSISAS
jgi:hypothetical protein